jgi:hypothetical protein
MLTSPRTTLKAVMSPVKGWGAVALVLTCIDTKEIIGVAGNTKPCNGIHYKLSEKHTDIVEAIDDIAPMMIWVSGNVFRFPVDEK